MTISNTIYKLTLVGEHLGQRTQNSFYFTDKATSLQDNRLESLVSLMNSFNDWITPSYALFCSSSWHGLGLLGIVLAPEPRYMLENGYEELAGGQDAESLPSDDAAVISLDTGLSGRSYRGRIYVPGIAKSSSDGNELTGSSFGQLTDLANNLAGRFSLAGTSLNHVLCVFSQKFGVVRDPGPPPRLTYHMEGMQPVEFLHARRLVCSMRRRRPDHGI